MDLLQLIVTLAASLGSGMMAGLFFVFSVVIMKALSRLAPAEGIAAMQSINRVILNLWFFAVFFGTALFGLLLSGITLFHWHSPASGFLIAATLLYLGGCIIVTIAGNVPLNDALAAKNPADDAAAAFWSRYLDVWTRWNHVRTVTCAASSILFTLAACQQ